MFSVSWRASLVPLPCAKTRFWFFPVAWWPTLRNFYTVPTPPSWLSPRTLMKKEVKKLESYASLSTGTSPLWDGLSVGTKHCWSALLIRHKTPTHSWLFWEMLQLRVSDGMSSHWAPAHCHRSHTTCRWFSTDVDLLDDVGWLYLFYWARGIFLSQRKCTLCLLKIFWPQQKVLCSEGMSS